jgi:hypothetical protein
VQAASAHQSRRPPLPTPDSGVIRWTQAQLYKGVQPHKLRHTGVSLAAKEAAHGDLPKRRGHGSPPSGGKRGCAARQRAEWCVLYAKAAGLVAGCNALTSGMAHLLGGRTANQKHECSEHPVARGARRCTVVSAAVGGCGCWSGGELGPGFGVRWGLHHRGSSGTNGARSTVVVRFDLEPMETPCIQSLVDAWQPLKGASDRQVRAAGCCSDAQHCRDTAQARICLLSRAGTLAACAPVCR